MAQAFRARLEPFAIKSLYLFWEFLFALEPLLLDLPHSLRIVCPRNSSIFGPVERFGMQVVAALSSGLLDFHFDAILFRVSVLANACHLPGDFYIRRGCANHKAIALDLISDYRLGKRSDDRELIAIVTIERFEVFGQCDCGFPVFIRDDIAVVDVHHVWRFNEGVIEVLQDRAVVNLERAAAFRKILCNLDTPVEFSSQPIGRAIEARAAEG